ncbi:MAG: hypothetical protein LUH15_05970 [Tannerellaceae bacterium]|nr:hypothetical protein [Tannerellaceae bacterium]
MPNDDYGNFLYNIIGSFLYNKSLYVVYEKWGIISIYNYEFVDPIKFKIQGRNLAGHMVTPALGPLTSKAIFKNINSDIYLFITMSQGRDTTTPSQLYLIKDIQNMDLLMFKSTSLNSTAILTLNESFKSWVDDVEEDEIEKLDEDNLKDYKTFIGYREAPYYFKKLSLKKNQKDELSDLSYSDGLVSYHFFNPKKLPLPNRKEIELTIKEVLTFCKTDTNIHYLDYILDELNDTVYFFYKDRKSRVQIITYEIQDSVWKMWDYKTERKKN